MGRTVLIVDDHSGFRASARELLEAEGFDIVGEASDAASAVQAARDNSTRMGRTVLIVDDHSGFRASARELLEAEGYEVVGEASDVESAIAATAQLRPDVVLLDVQLPDGDGVEAAKEIDTRSGRTEIVLISSRSLFDLGDALANCPACGFIPKSELCGESLRELIG